MSGLQLAMGHGGSPKPSLAAVPLFPLPNMVLFPRAIAPLLIFEERYKLMMADALAGSRLIAMALLRPGWQSDYYGKPEIEPVVCVGEILTHERLAGGEYNLLLQGQLRATIVLEKSEHAYRTATLRPVVEISDTDYDLGDAREALALVLSRAEFIRIPGIEQFRELASGILPVQDLADLLAFHVLDDLELKQSLLAEADVGQRVKRTIAALEEIRTLFAALGARTLGNPSMN